MAVLKGDEACTQRCVPYRSLGGAWADPPNPDPEAMQILRLCAMMSAACGGHINPVGSSHHLVTGPRIIIIISEHVITASNSLAVTVPWLAASLHMASSAKL
jgi:hypothetical protein